MTTNYRKTKDDVLKMYKDFLPLIASARNAHAARIHTDGTGELKTNYDDLLASLGKQAENIRDDKFLLMVAGEAKSGKSTFINAYLGEDILPMDVKQCTSAIVEIRYGKRFRLKATYADNREESITDEQKIKEFLANNAALNDNYRSIPVSTINYEIIMKKKGHKIFESEIQDLLKGIDRENIYNLPKADYEAKVRKYIKETQPKWQNIVKKIEIEYPFADEDLRTIEIVDTPGVNADGRVGDITNQYIEKANAVMFLKPLTGQALEASSFREFLKSKSADRNRNAMFLILTRAANETEANVDRIHDDAIQQFKGINPQQIIPVDSKAELIYKTAQKLTQEELQNYIVKMGEEKRLDNFTMVAWFTAKGNREDFLKQLRELSRFSAVDNALNRFAHKAHYLALSDFLKDMLAVMEKVGATLEENTGFYREKAEDPKVLASKMKEITKELDEMSVKINRTVNDIRARYTRTDGEIDQSAQAEIDDYLKRIDSIDPDDSRSVDELEKISFQKIDVLADFEQKLQKNVVAECDEALVALGNKSELKYAALKPDFTKEKFDEIKDKIRNSSAAHDTQTYTTGITFTSTHTRSVFSQKKYFKAVSRSIRSRIEGIRDQAVADLKEFTTQTVAVYRKQLASNVEIKKAELNEIAEKKQTAEEIQATIHNLENLSEQIYAMEKKVKGMKGGIDDYV